MIARYSRKELTTIWSEENKYKIWLDVELAAAQAMEKLGREDNLSGMAGTLHECMGLWRLG